MRRRLNAGEFHQSIPESFGRVAKKYPHRTAVKSVKHHLTYLQLDRLSNQLAHKLLALSPAPGAPVALLMEHEAPLAAALVGILKTGRAYVPLHPGYPPYLLKLMLSNAKACLLVTDSANMPLAAQLTGNGAGIVCMEDIKEETPDSAPGIPVPPSAPAYIIYTSGSLGLPKGVRHNHKNIQRTAKAHAKGIRLRPGDRVLSIAHYSFSMAVLDIFSALLTGAELHFCDLPGQGISSCIQWIQREGITMFQSTVSIFSHLVETLEGSEDFSRVRVIKLGGEPVYRSHFEQFKKHFPRGCRLLNGYGLSEILGVTQYFLGHRDTVTGALVPVGFPTKGLELLILGEKGEPLPPGETGAIAIKSKFLFQGYQGRPGLSRQKLFPDPKNKQVQTLHTGDMGYRTPDGCMTFLGRKDLQVKINGVRVELSEIEDSLRSHPLIKEALVNTVTTGSRQQLEALVATAGEELPSTVNLKDFLRAKLPGHMVPAVFTWVPEIPRSTSGKLDRNYSGPLYTSVPKWTISPQKLTPSAHPRGKKHAWLVMNRHCGIGTALLKGLRRQGEHVITVEPGNGFKQLDKDRFLLRPGHEDDFHCLAREMDTGGRDSLRILHLWSLWENSLTVDESPLQNLPQTLDTAFFSLVFLAKSLPLAPGLKSIHLEVLTGPIFNITGREKLRPGASPVLGPCEVIPREYPSLSCRCVDIDARELNPTGAEQLAEQLIAGGPQPLDPQVAAFRDGHWYYREWEPLEQQKKSLLPGPLRMGGVYLVTGGLGGIGLELARFLAAKVKAKLVLLNRSRFLPRDFWEEWLATHDEKDKISSKINKLLEIEKSGGKVLQICADVADMGKMREALAHAHNRFGVINGVIHAAGVPGTRGIAHETRESAWDILAPKIKGTLVLDSLLPPTSLDFFVLCSSAAPVFGRAGTAGVTAGNAYLDTFAQAQAGSGDSKKITVAINWDTWRQVGMAVDLAGLPGNRHGEKERLKNGLLNREGAAAFEAILYASAPRVLVSKCPGNTGKPGQVPRHHRSSDPSPAESQYHPYRPPRTPIELMLLNTWEKWLKKEAIGIEDNFFHLGGDSLKASGILAEIKTHIGKDLKVEALLQAPTVEKLSALLSEEQWSSGWEYLVPILPAGSEPPFFCVHNLSGDVWSIAGLRPYMPPGRPLYGLQVRDLTGKQEPPDRIEDIAANYLEEITRLQPGGPYFLGGRCFGGLVAFEMAQQLTARGKEVKLLVIVDGAHPRPRSNGKVTEPSQMPVQEENADKIMAAHRRAMVNYYPHPFPGNILMLHSKEHIGRRYKNWRQFAGERFISHLIPCNHFELLKEPYVAILAEHLRKAFGEPEHTVNTGPREKISEEQKAGV